MRLLWILACAAVQAAPLWRDAAGRPTADAGVAMEVLAAAADDGLAPGDYGLSQLRSDAAALARAPTGERGAAFDAALEAAMRRYLRDLHAGRVDPRAAGFHIPPHPPEDFGPRLREAVRSHTVARLPSEVMPAVPLYGALRGALARNRALAADLSLAPPQSERDDDAVVRLLRRLGDLRPGEAIDAGVRRFQVRHGLEPDGVVGRRTLAQLRVPPAARVEQITLSMERLRWLPDRDSPRLIAVNIPMFRLWAIEGDEPVFTTEVIVGRALNTRTPVFVDALEQIVFRPSWNVPASILRTEIRPALHRDPAYLEKHNMEALPGGGVRQRPGPQNALGLIKFSFPNDADVYMHGTPSGSLFSRARRDFSHGCIRVADPAALAEWALAGDGWDRARIEAATRAPVSSAATLSAPIRVVLFYMTALVLPGDSTVWFADDIYGHDARLRRALERQCESRM